MKNWIELTRLGAPELVNLERVVAVRKHFESGSVLVWVDGVIHYDESYADVCLMIKQEGEEQIFAQTTERVGNLEVRETIYDKGDGLTAMRTGDGRCSPRCNKSILFLGKPMPRTCNECKLGPCKFDK